jgi:radical SAM superfamily enzyme YgiQ (UPF0313 family)
MSRILLIFPRSPFPILASSSGSGVLKKPLGFVPPLGILYVGRALLDADYEVEAVDFNSTPYTEATLGKLLAEKQAVGITTSSFNREDVIKLIKDIRRMKPEIKVITGGPDITLHPRLIEGSDLSVAGEAEKSAPEIFDAAINGKNLSTLHGAIYKTPLSNKILFGREPYFESDLDSIKFPARQLLRTEEKSLGYNLFGEKNKTKIATIIVTRGCPFQCRFCAHNAVTFRGFRKRSIKNCLDEIEQIHKEGFSVLGFVDDNFLSIVNKELVKGICNGIIERGYKFSIIAEGRVDSAKDPEMYALMRKAGAAGVVYGMESMNQKVLDFYRKKTTVELNRRASQLAYKYGLFAIAHFIIGAPFEDEEVIKKMVKDAYSLRLDAATFWALEYTYGAPLWEEIKEKGMIDESEHTVPAGSERGLSPLSSSQLHTICYKAFRGYYARLSYWFRFLEKAVKFDRRTIYLLLRVLEKALPLYLHSGSLIK